MLLKKTKWRSVGTVMAELLDLCSNSAPFFYFILKSIFLEDKDFQQKA